MTPKYVNGKRSNKSELKLYATDKQLATCPNNCVNCKAYNKAVDWWERFILKEDLR